MIKDSDFKEWLKDNTNYSAAAVTDVVSRVRRADRILEWNGDPAYQFYLEQIPEYKRLSCSVRSQIKKAVRFYAEFTGAVVQNKM